MVKCPTVSRNDCRRSATMTRCAIGIMFVFWPQSGHADKPTIVLERALIMPVQEIEIPALKAGVLEEILRHEGEVVRSGEVLARLQDHQALLAMEQAEIQADVASHLAENHFELESAEKKLEQALQAVKQQELELEAARLEAENQLRVQAADKNQAVAKNEYDRANLSRATFIDSVSESELDGLRLNFERAGLEAAQAAFEMRLAQLKATVAEETLQTLLLTVETSRVEVSQAKSRIVIAGFNAGLKQSELKMAQAHVNEHRLTSKLEGVVVDVYRQPGEWVEPGEPVLRILRLNRLRAEAFLKMEDLNFDWQNARAELEVMIGEEPLRITGKIAYLSPEIDPINRETSLWMEFDNPNLKVKPGMHGRIEIFLTQ